MSTYTNEAESEKQFTKRGLAISVPNVSLYGFNEVAQRIRSYGETGQNIYEYVLPEGVADVMINQASSFCAPIGFVVIGSALALHQAQGCEPGEVEYRPVKLTAISVAAFTGYEFMQADYDLKEVDVADCAAILLAGAVLYGAFSKRMPWNKSKSSNLAP